MDSDGERYRTRAPHGVHDGTRNVVPGGSEIPYGSPTMGWTVVSYAVSRARKVPCTTFTRRSPNCLPRMSSDPRIHVRAYFEHCSSRLVIYSWICYPSTTRCLENSQPFPSPCPAWLNLSLRQARTSFDSGNKIIRSNTCLMWCAGLKCSLLSCISRCCLNDLR